MPFTSESAHYSSKTDVAEHVAKNAAKAMELLFKEYQRIFRVENSELPKKKTDLIIFKKKEAFIKYAESLGAAPKSSTLGFYRTSSRGPDMIVTYRRQTDDFHTLSTLYHEGTHQFVMMVMGPGNKPPLWLNEGLAVYFESSKFRNGKLRTGIIPRKRLMLLQRALKQNKHVPLADLMKRTRANYDGLCYSEGWSVIYFLVKARRGAYAKRFGNYFRALKKGEDPDKAFATHITTRVDKLEKLWKAWVLKLPVPKK
jgi:uncharacterized protein DUF1570